MNTSTFTTRRSVEEMQKILEATQRAQELATREAAAAREEQRNIAYENQVVSAQNAINNLCQTVDNHYNEMVEAGKAYMRNERKVADKQKELNLFVATADEMFLVEEIDQTKEMQMRNRVTAYKSLPFIDFVFGLLAIVPIFIYEFRNMVPQANDAVIIIGGGIALSLFVGFILAHITRLAIAGISNNDNVVKKTIPYLSTLILPGIYVVGATIFATGLIYNGIFGSISLFIQLFIALQYKNHMEAFAYLNNLDAFNQKRAERENAERAIREEVQAVSDARERIIGKFNDHYNEFTNAFRSVVVEYESYGRKYEEPYIAPLGQLLILFGDMQCFQQERLKLQRNTDGSIATMPAAVSHEFATCYSQLTQQVGNSIHIINMMLVNVSIGLPIPLPEQPTALAEGQNTQNLKGEETSVAPQTESTDDDNDDIDMPEAWQ